MTGFVYRRLAWLLLILGVVGLGDGTVLKAERVAWKEAKNIQGDADVSSVGILVDGIQCYAGRNVQGSGKPAVDITIGDTVFHAVTGSGANYGDGTITVVTGAPNAGFVNGNIRENASADVQFNALPAGGGISSGYSTVVSNGIFYQGSAVGSIILNKLVPGHLYQIQIWGMVQDGRPGLINFYDDLGNTGTLDSRAGLPKKGPLTPGQSYGQSVIGQFQASQTETSIDWGGEATVVLIHVSAPLPCGM